MVEVATVSCTSSSPSFACRWYCPTCRGTNLGPIGICLRVRFRRCRCGGWSSVCARQRDTAMVSLLSLFFFGYPTWNTSAIVMYFFFLSLSLSLSWALSHLLPTYFVLSTWCQCFFVFCVTHAKICYTIICLFFSFLGNILFYILCLNTLRFF